MEGLCCEQRIHPPAPRAAESRNPGLLVKVAQREKNNKSAHTCMDSHTHKHRERSDVTLKDASCPNTPANTIYHVKKTDENFPGNHLDRIVCLEGGQWKSQ